MEVHPAHAAMKGKPMNRRKNRNLKRGGRLTLTVLLGLVVIVSLCLSGWYVYHQTAADLKNKEKDLKIALAKVDILQHRVAELHRNAAKHLEKKTTKKTYHKHIGRGRDDFLPDLFARDNLVGIAWH